MLHCPSSVDYEKPSTYSGHCRVLTLDPMVATMDLIDLNASCVTVVIGMFASRQRVTLKKCFKGDRYSRDVECPHALQFS